MLKLFGSLMETEFLQSFKIPPQRLLVTKRKMATTVRKSGGRHLHRTWFNLILPTTGNPSNTLKSCIIINAKVLPKVYKLESTREKTTRQTRIEKHATKQLARVLPKHQ